MAGTIAWPVNKTTPGPFQPIQNTELTIPADHCGTLQALAFFRAYFQRSERTRR